jgi:hypothetical protein
MEQNKPEEITPIDPQILIDELRNFKKYASKELFIKTKKGEILNFNFNSEQEKVLNIIATLRDQNKPIRLLLLKSRQVGMSTFAEGVIFHDTSTRPRRNSLIISHDPDGTKNLFEMCKFFYEKLRPEIRPMKRYSNKKELVFDNPDEKARLAGERGLESSLIVSTANKSELRGSTIHNFHGSEVAFWQNASKLLLACLQMIPDDPDTIVILESTANGIGGSFYDMWVKAINKQNDFVPVFLPWWAFKDYEREPGPVFILTEEEQAIKKTYNLTDQKLAWRRWAIANKCEGSITKFNQEYPACWEEAFVSSGTPKFNMVNLRLLYAHRADPVFVGEIEGEDWRSPHLRATPEGRLKIYKLPIKDHYYVVGGDVAKGTPTSDFSCLQVFDASSGDHVATWYGKTDPVSFATMGAMVGKFYEGAWGSIGAFLGIEVNRDGISTNRALYYDLQYPNIYYRKNLSNAGDDRSDSLGFHTSGTTRPIIINALASYINNGEGELHDTQTLLDCQTFIINESGFPEAQEGCHDDSVIALGIALHLANYVVLPTKKESTDEVRSRVRKERGTEEDQYFRKLKTHNQDTNW